MPPTRNPGTRYWTFLRYCAALAVLLNLAFLVKAGWHSGAGKLFYLILWISLPFALLSALALWRPRPLGWCFILAASGANALITGLSWMSLLGATQGWWSFHFPPDQMNPLVPDAIVSLCSIAVSFATLQYFKRRRGLFVPPQMLITRLHWLIAVSGGSLFVLLSELVVAMHRPTWSPAEKGARSGAHQENAALHCYGAGRRY